jgi:hypothetical protein
LYIDILLDEAIEEGSLNIHLLNFEIKGSCNCKQSFVAYRLDDRGKGLIVVDTKLLLVSFSNPSGFVSKNLSTNSSLVFKDPFARKDLLMVRRFDKIPGIIINKGGELFFCSLEPFGPILLAHCSLPRLRFVRFRRRSFS